MPTEISTISKELKTGRQLLFLATIKDGRILSMNRTATVYLGFDGKALTNTMLPSYSDLVHPDDFAAYMAHLKSFITAATDEERDFELRLREKDGTWNKFRIRNRLYHGASDNGDVIVLSLADQIIQDPRDLEKGSERNVRVLQNDYDHLVDSLDEGFAIIELLYNREGAPIDYYYRRINPAFEKQVDIKDITGKTVREFIPTPKEHWLEIFGKIAETGETLRFQDQNSNLKDYWLDLYAFKVGDPDSGRVAVLFRNITGRKLEEEKLKNEVVAQNERLRESNELLQTVFDTTNVGIAVLKIVYDEQAAPRDFRFIRVNKVLRELYLDQDVLGKTYLEISKYGIKAGIYDALLKVAAMGEPLDREFFVETEKGDKWFRITARRQNDLLLVNLEDVTARKAEIEEFKENLRFKQELGKASQETIMIINLNTFSVRYINKDVFPEVGLTREKVEGMGLADIVPYIHPRDREKVLELHRKLLKASKDEILDMEIRLKLKGIAWEWFNVRGKVFNRRDASWVDEYVLLATNITEQKNIQKALVKAETLSIKGEVARTFAHELRNPLASIGMVGDVLSRTLDAAGNKKFGNYLAILKRSTKTLNEMVTNLLNSSNYSPAALIKSDLAEIVNETIHKASDRIYLAGIKLIKNYDGPYYVLADREKLEIALLNIIVNASEATSPGKGVIEISVQKKDSDYILSIADNGHGMEKEEIDKLFQAFYTKKNTGVGIGLSSVKTILEEHDAQVKVESEPGEGTCFHLSFQQADQN